MSTENHTEFAPQSLHTPGFFPKALVPDWLTFHPELNEGALSVAQLLQAFADPNGSLPTIGRKRIAARFGKSVDWVDRRTRDLARAGWLVKVPMYRHAETGERTLDQFTAAGAANAQTSNTWIVRDAPPLGDEHPHPISSSEFCHPEKIDERIAARRKLAAAMEGGRTTAAGVSPAEPPDIPSSPPGRTHAAPPAAPQRPRGPHHSGPNKNQEEQEPAEQPTTTAPSASAADDRAGSGNVGWLEAPQKDNPKTTDSLGASLLRSLRAEDGTGLSAAAIAEHADQVTAWLEAGHTEKAIRLHLSGGRSAGFIRSKLRKLTAGEERLPSRRVDLRPMHVRPAQPKTSTPENLAERAGPQAFLPTRLRQSA